ncbi:hypothetical protein, partial [Tunturiibacter psychrotolerans]|uniref:hypothetical protein n=1 Tax=Tunturiibacter psychrotolerans TaxID=3069686 RepID=UPI003D1FAEDF
GFLDLYLQEFGCNFVFLTVIQMEMARSPKLPRFQNANQTTRARVVIKWLLGLWLINSSKPSMLSPTNFGIGID